ncbi:MAG TPA: IS110 family transposase [Candidatus Acidoferrum sp.]|nr:IS110 family transposase [Candidatus Acidoferrum sp.]
MDKMAACGMEVSAQELVIASSGKKGEAVLLRFANTAAGHGQLLRTLTRGGKRVRVCMEATGVYGLDVALLLSAQEGVELMVANPRAVRNFARAMMQRSKNDQLDAVVLREFAARMPFQAWARPTENTLALWAIARRLKALTKEGTAEKNRLHAARVSQAIPACVRRNIARTLRFHQREMQQLRGEALRCIAADARLRRRYQQPRSVTGIGEISAIQILAELALLPEDLDVRQWVAFAGLDPREYSSGTSVRKYTRISKVGNRHLRQALFMHALVASRREPHLRAFYEHLLASGKKKRQALVAVARKLLHAIYGMFRSDQPYDGARVFQLPASLATPLAAHAT